MRIQRWVLLEGDWSPPNPPLIMQCPCFELVVGPVKETTLNIL
jgi:hypothetical protein